MVKRNQSAMATLANHAIVCFGPSDWWGMNPSSATHIMRRLAQSNRILYVNPVSSDLLGVRNHKGLAVRIWRKLKSMLRFVRRVDRHLYVMSPFFMPIQGHPVVDRLNNAVLKMQLGAAMLLLRFKQPLLWVENIRAADCLNWFNWRLIVYHASDKFDECCNTRNKSALQQREKRISERSDVIVCASRKIYESKRTQNTNVHYLPHGVDAELFCTAAERWQPRDGLDSSSSPTAGYFGTLTGQNDIEMLEYCARSLPHIRFVFAGRVTGGDYEKLRKMSNVRFLGHVPYEEIPHLCARFDVCLLPWRMSPWIEHCNPLKLFEYMASGKPIVSVPICEVQDQYSDVVAVAETREQFCRAIEHELANDTDQRKNLRIQTAMRHTWEKHSDQLTRILTDALSGSLRV
ncbi:MAG: glycosyltransferase [Phycisphaerae bacterium]|nr:glycosyltransferase [Phycisphaerae bacterium]